MMSAHLPVPEINRKVEGRRRDAVWASAKLVAEIDGYRWHSTRFRFEGDRRRDQELVAAGYRVLRFTWHQIKDGPEEVVATVAQALAQ